MDKDIERWECYDQLLIRVAVLTILVLTFLYVYRIFSRRDLVLGLYWKFNLFALSTDIPAV